MPWVTNTHLKYSNIKSHMELSQYILFTIGQWNVDFGLIAAINKNRGNVFEMHIMSIQLRKPLVLTHRHVSDQHYFKQCNSQY